MGKTVAHRQSAFAAGEVAPSLHGRIDSPQHAQGLETCRNFIVNRYGSLEKRVGFEWCYTLADPAWTGGETYAPFRLIPFRYQSTSDFNDQQNYALCFANNSGHGVTKSDISGIADAGGGDITVTTSDVHGLSIGDYITQSGCTDSAYNGTFVVLTVPTTTTYTVTAVYTATDTGTTDVAGALYVFRDGSLRDTVILPAGWAAAKVLWSLTYAQAGDTMIFAAGQTTSSPIQKLVRTSDTSWAFSDNVHHADRTAVGAVSTVAAKTNLSSGAGIKDQPPDPTATNEAQTVGAYWEYGVSSVDETGDESGLATYASADNPISIGSDVPGRHMIDWASEPSDADKIRIYRRITDGVWGRIGYYEVTVGGASEFEDHGQEPNYDLRPRLQDAADESTLYNHGAFAVCFFGQRLVYGNLLNTSGEYFEGRIIASRLALYKDWELGYFPTAADDPVDFALATTQYERIQHLVPVREMVVLTDTTEWSVNTLSGTIADMSVRPHSQIGACRITPVVIGYQVIFVQRLQKTVHALTYSDQHRGYIGTDIIWSSRHLTDDKTIEDLAYQRNPDSIVWFPVSDGTMIAQTYLPDYGVVGWHRHDTSGYSYTDATKVVTGPSIDSVCTISENGNDVLYAVVRRQDSPAAGDRTRWYLERITSQIPATLAHDRPWCDSWVKYDNRNGGNITMKFTGSTYAVGETDVVITASATGSNGPENTPFGSDNAGFTSADIGREVWIDPDGAAGVGPLKITITEITDTTHAKGTLGTAIPVAYRDTTTTDWGMTATTWPSDAGTAYHLMGRSLELVVDGVPLTGQTSSDAGVITSPAAVVLIAGEQIVAQVQTLQLPGNAEARASLKNTVNAEIEVDDLALPTTDNSGLKFGDTLDDNLVTIGREQEDADGRIEAAVESTSRKGGQVALQYTDAAPLKIRSITRWVTIEGGKR